MSRASLVHLDDDEAGSQRRGAKDMEEEVRERSGAFLLGGMCGLEDKGCLNS